MEKRRVFELEKETNQSLKEPYREATIVNLKENGKPHFRMWLKKGERTACAFHHAGDLWLVLFRNEKRIYQIGQGEVTFTKKQTLKRELDAIIDGVWSEYKSLIA